MTYQGDGVVASKRWEGVRDGVEDFAMLYALREAAKAAEVAGTKSKAVARAESLLQDGASSIAAFCGLDDDGTVPGKGGIPAVRVLADKRFAAIQKMRKAIAETMAQLN
jgi:hypothetical protein